MITRIRNWTLVIVLVIAMSGLTACSSASNKEAAAAATVAAARSTEAVAVQIIAQATQSAQRPAPTATGRTPTPAVTATSAPKATSTASSSGGAGTWTVTGEDPFGGSYEMQLPVGQGPAGPVPMPPGMGNLPLIAQMVGGSGSSASTPTAAPSPAPVVLDTRAAVPIRYGDVITQEIKSSGNMGTYMFDGKAGDIAFIVASGTADASWLKLQVKLYDAQGKPVAAASDGRGEYILAADGRYIFTIRDAGTQIGPYNVLLKNAGPGKGIRVAYGTRIGAEMVVPGDPFGPKIAAEITVPGDVHFYSFTGKTGDIVRIAMTNRAYGSATESTRKWIVELLDPERKRLAGGDTWGRGGETAIIEKALATDGEYTVKVYAGGTLDTPTTGLYALLVKNVALAAGTRITYGNGVTGTITPEGDKDVYVFEWKPGDKVAIEAASGAGLGNSFYPQIEILDAKGNSLAKGPTNYTQPVIQIKPPLSEAGLYMVTVEGKLHVHWDTGGYTLSLKNLAAP